MRLLDRTKRPALACGVASLIVAGIGAVGLAGLANGASTGVSLNGGDMVAVTCSGKNLAVTAYRLRRSASPATASRGIRTKHVGTVEEALDPLEL